MSKQQHRDRKDSVNRVRLRQENEAKRQQSVAEYPSTNGRRTPCYDAERRELRVGERFVKCFTQKSDAQEVILQVFEEENWPYRIDDPLPGEHGKDPKDRLRRTVDNLNRRQLVRLIQFGVALQGTAVTWQFRKQRR